MKIEETTKTFKESGVCPKPLNMKIGKDNMVAWTDTPVPRQKCIAMTDELQPNLNCQFEVMNDEVWGGGK